MSDFADRLREERCRLGLNQNTFGAIGGVTLDAQSRYERSQRSPNAEYLMAIAAAGADVRYILTGQRIGDVVPKASDGSIPDFPEIDAAMVLDVLEGLELHLKKNRSTIAPEKKARVVRLLCEMIIEKRRNQPDGGSRAMNLNDFKEIISLAK